MTPRYRAAYCRAACCRAPGRRGFTLLEILISMTILAGALAVAYGMLQNDYRYGMDLQDRHTADVLARNLLDRYRTMPPEDLLELVGGDGSYDPGLLGDETLDAIDPRSPEELDRLGFRRTLEVSQRGGLLGGITFRTRVSWKSHGGRRDDFTYGVARVDVDQLGRRLGEPSGFGAEARELGWGKAQKWEAPEVAPAGGGFPGSLARAAQEASRSYVDDDYRPGALARRGPPELWENLEESRPLRTALAAQDLARQQAAPEQRRAEFIQRVVKGDLGKLETAEIPDGEYTFSLEAHDRGDGDRLGLLELRGEGREHLLVLRERGDPRVTHLRGDVVLASRELRDRRGRSWTLMRTEDRLFLIEDGDGFGLRRIVLHTLEIPDGGSAPTTLTGRAVQAFLDGRELTAGEASPGSPLEAALARGGL